MSVYTTSESSQYDLYEHMGTADKNSDGGSVGNDHDNFVCSLLL